MDCMRPSGELYFQKISPKSERDSMNLIVIITVNNRPVIAQYTSGKAKIQTYDDGAEMMPIHNIPGLRP